MSMHSSHSAAAAASSNLNLNLVDWTGSSRSITKETNSTNTGTVIVRRKRLSQLGESSSSSISVSRCCRSSRSGCRRSTMLNNCRLHVLATGSGVQSVVGRGNRGGGGGDFFSAGFLSRRLVETSSSLSSFRPARALGGALPLDYKCDSQHVQCGCRLKSVRCSCSSTTFSGRGRASGCRLEEEQKGGGGGFREKKKKKKKGLFSSRWIMSPPTPNPEKRSTPLVSIHSVPVSSSLQQKTANSEDDKMVSPSDEFLQTAHISSKKKYDKMYERSIADPDGFWGEIAAQFFWKTKWDVKEDGKLHNENFDVRKGPIHVEWFKGGQTNICYNAVDRHVEAGRGNETAFLWEGNEPGYDGSLTFGKLLDDVGQLSNYLRSLGVGKGDAVVIYMPMLTELPVAMLACARIGAIHSVVFAGFSAESLAQRILDCKPKVVLTASGVMRGPKMINLKQIVDDSLAKAGKEGFSIGTVLVYANEIALARKGTGWSPERDVWWQDVVPSQAKESPIEWVEAEHPLFLLYTSGSTGKPKGVLHTTGGYMVWTATTFKYAFDYHAGDIFWCTADCGWITGHSYVTYGPLLNGATQVVFEGTPTYPDEGRCWEIVDKYKVNIFYTAPTAIRSLMRAGDEPVKRHSRKSLKVLGSVGEPINPAAWRWYYDVVGDGRCPISDTWWQTETGGFMITPIPGAWPLKPGSATFPFFGVQPAIVDENGKELEGECSGYLCVKSAWPGTFRTLYGDHPRYETTYYAPFKGFYFSGDGCYRDKDGYYWLTGRVDDVINVSGHRIGSAEVESALVSHPQCAEAAVVGYEHDVKGQGIYAFVTLVEGVEYSAELRKQLVATVRAQIGPFAAPDRIHWAPGLPKTRSGKIMRRILRKIASNEIDQLGDVSTLADPGVVDQLIALRDQ